MRLPNAPLTTTVLLLALSAAAQADTVTVNLGASTVGNFTETGLGATPSNYATWAITPGLSYSASTPGDSEWVLFGSYTSSNTVLGSGTYVFVTEYAAGDAIEAISLGNDPVGNPTAANELAYTNLNSSIFEAVQLTPNGSSPILIPLLFGNTAYFSATWGFFYVPGAQCSGLGTGVACSEYNVGITPGATISGPVTGVVNFDSSALTAVPLPAAAWLLLSGLSGLAVTSRKRKLRV